MYELLEQKGQVTAKWYHAPLALLALLTVSMAALQDMRFILLLVDLGVLWWISARLGTLAGKYKVVMQGFWGAAAMLLLAASRQLGTREAIPANWLVALALLGVSWCVLTVFPIRAIQGGKRNGDLPGGVQHGLQALQCGAAAGCGACCAVRGILT